MSAVVVTDQDRAAIRNAARDMARGYASFESAVERFRRASRNVPELEVAQAIHEGVASNPKLRAAMEQVFERILAIESSPLDGDSPADDPRTPKSSS